MVVTPILASRASVAGPAHIRSTGSREGTRVQSLDRRRPIHPASRPAMRSSPGAWYAPRRLTSASQARRTRARTVLAISAGEPKRCVHPATSAKASSMEMRSMDGVKSLRTPMAASPSRWYSSKCPPTNTVGTELPRASSRHAASHAEGPRFVGGREHDAAADRNRLAAGEGRAAVRPTHKRRRGPRGEWWRWNHHHTHHSADASRDSSSAGPTPRRSATGAPAAIKRFSSVVNTRKRSKEARVKASRRAATGRR